MESILPKENEIKTVKMPKCFGHLNIKTECMECEHSENCETETENIEEIKW